jgi:hypothetical protein
MEKGEKRECGLAKAAMGGAPERASSSVRSEIGHI